MKKAILVGVVVAISKLASAQPISSVTVFPESPFPSAIVTVRVDGDLWATNVFIEQTNFSQTDNILTLDMYWGFEGIGLPVVLPYTYWEPIGMFANGEYILNVNSFFWGNYDFGTTSFTVIPEPTTLLLLGLGAVMVRRKRSFK